MERGAEIGAEFVLVPESWTALGAARLVDMTVRQYAFGTFGSWAGIEEIPSSDNESHSWVPLENSMLPEELAALADTDDEQLAHWVAAHGPFGVDTVRIGRTRTRTTKRPRDRASARVEFVADIRDSLDVLRHAIGLRDALRDPVASQEAVWGAIRACTWREPSGLASLGVSVLEISPAADPRVRALSLLSYTAAIGMGSAFNRGDPVLTADVVGDRSEVRARAELHPLGPIPCAFALLFSQALTMRIKPTSGRVRQGRWTPRSCARCGRVFNPRTQKAAWCGERCRWAASKAGIVNPWAQPDLSAEQFRDALLRDPARTMTRFLTLRRAEQQTLVRHLQAPPKRPSINSSQKGS